MTTPPRPKVDKEMVLRAAQQVMPDGAEDIAKEYHYPMDGFELCKSLDKWQMWDSTREEMEKLDEMDFVVAKLIEDAEKEWFEKNDIKPPLEIGTVVLLPRGGRGHITEISKFGHGKYLVKPEGQEDEASGYRRHVIAFEDAVPA